MDRISEIEARVAEISTAIDSAEGEELRSLSTELDGLINERDMIAKDAEARQAMRDTIASSTAESIIEKNEEKEERTMDINSLEYRNAYLDNLRGKANEEQRSAIAASGALIPTMLEKSIVELIKEQCPLIDKVTLFRTKGYVQFKVENSINAAAEHTENAEISGAGDTFTTVTLGAKEIAKLITLSETALAMSYDSFADYIVSQLARMVAEEIEKELIQGDGSTSGKTCNGIASITFTDNTNAIDYGDAVTAANLRSCLSLLPGRAAKNAAWLMSRKDFWANIVGLSDDETQVAIVKNAGGDIWYVYGVPVLFSDFVPSGVYYVGDYSKIYANLGENIAVESSRESGFRYGSVDFRALTIFDCAPADAGAFVKLHT